MFSLYDSSEQNLFNISKNVVVLTDLMFPMTILEAGKSGYLSFIASLKVIVLYF